MIDKVIDCVMWGVGVLFVSCFLGGMGVIMWSLLNQLGKV